MITISKHVKEAEKPKGITLNDLAVGTTFTGGLKDSNGVLRFGLWVKLNGPVTIDREGLRPKHVDVLVAGLTPGSHAWGGPRHSLQIRCQEIVNYKEVDVEITVKEK